MKIRRLAFFIIIPLALWIAVSCRSSADHAPQKVGTLEGVLSPFSMAAEGNELFVGDENHTVRVYSIEPFALKFTIGGKGDGPGDFQFPPTVWVTAEAIVASDFTKSLWFLRTGQFLKAVNYSDFPDFDPHQSTLLFPAGEISIRIVSNHPDHKRTVILFDRELRPLETLYEGLFDWNQLGGPAGFNLLNHRIEVVVGNDEIYISDTEKGFFIRVFSLDGRSITTIDLTASEEAVPVSAADREMLLEEVRWTRSEKVYEYAKTTARFPETFPRIHEIRYSDGRLYVTTHRKMDGLHEMLVLEPRGKVLKRMYLPFPSFHHFRASLVRSLFAVSGGSLFELVKNPETQAWELVRTALTNE
jgi:hypothetical protein